MSEAKERSEWNRAAAIVVKLHNTHIIKEKDKIKFQDVHPYFTMKEFREQDESPSEEQMMELQRGIEGFGG